jgi:hypothetical protein
VRRRSCVLSFSAANPVQVDQLRDALPAVGSANASPGHITTTLVGRESGCSGGGRLAQCAGIEVGILRVSRIIRRCCAGVLVGVRLVAFNRIRRRWGPVRLFALCHRFVLQWRPYYVLMIADSWTRWPDRWQMPMPSNRRTSRETTSSESVTKVLRRSPSVGVSDARRFRPETFDDHDRALRGGHQERLVRTSLRANDVAGVKLFAARQALHDWTIGKIQTLALTSDIRLPAIVRRSEGETQRYQLVATAVGACGQSPSMLPRAASAFRTVANRSNANEFRALNTAIAPRSWVDSRAPARQRKRRASRCSHLIRTAGVPAGRLASRRAAAPTRAHLTHRNRTRRPRGTVDAFFQVPPHGCVRVMAPDLQTLFMIHEDRKVISDDDPRRGLQAWVPSGSALSSPSWIPNAVLGVGACVSE